MPSSSKTAISDKFAKDLYRFFVPVSEVGLSAPFFPDGLNLKSDTIIAPDAIPPSIQRNITIARDASNVQKRKVIVTGMAFCTENIATRTRMIDKRIIVTIIHITEITWFLNFSSVSV
jgi:hypothetical protein